MAGTYTDNLSLYKPATLESGWADVVNQNFDTIDSGSALNVKAPVFGAVGDGVTDDSAAIQAAIDATDVGGTVYIPAGVYAIHTGLVVTDKKNVTILGAGAEHNNYLGSPTTGTVLNWEGSAGGTVVKVDTTTALTSSTRGNRIIGVSVDGKSSAAKGIDVVSQWGGEYRDIHIRNCTTVGLDLRTIDLSVLDDTQSNVFDHISVRQYEAGSGIGVRMDSATDGIGNVSVNRFGRVSVFHKDGVGFQMIDSDSNIVEMLHVNRSGAGIGVEFVGSNTVSTGHCRGNDFLYVSAGPGGLTSRGSGYSTPATNNTIQCYALENSAPLPTVEAGSKLWYQTDRGSVVFQGGPILLSGTGSPESAVTAPIGSLYMRVDGGASTSLYVKQSGTGNTGWVGK